MKEIKCEGCGSIDFYEENGYRICKYCGKKYVITKEDKPDKYSDISLNQDVKILLEKWDQNPSDAGRYADLILQIDPGNERARMWKAQQRTKSNSGGGGCYIATSVYGSYNCPQVWTLRRYRDYSLGKSWYGRLFIKTYYAISPHLVKRFGDKKWFKVFWRNRLDSMIAHLMREGYQDTPYTDQEW